MKLTIVFAALALACGVTAQGFDREDSMREFARSLIEEYDDFLEARATCPVSGGSCPKVTCQKYCLKGADARGVGSCFWTPRSTPPACKTACSAFAMDRFDQTAVCLSRLEYILDLEKKILYGAVML
ncbi:hypothetical protein BKA70DRAFT_1227759 [Coprinopsis sp. MPI-PUGE-AT-0042]|nr:hypothetical protein BKA70DRAFT_1227759 [Coprinopsis sp. MPI-PUGE-AT-0042]